jgi:AraC-like DNA-binding protein
MSSPAHLALDRPAADHWAFPRSVSGVSLLLEFAAEHGVSRSVALRGARVEEPVLADPAGVVPAAAELTVLSNLSSALGERPTLGLELGARYHVTTFGILGYALMSSRTVAEAMRLALRFLDLSHIFTVPAVTVEGADVAVELRAVDLPAGLARFLVERDVAAIHTVLSELVPGGVAFTSVELAFAAPGHDHRWREQIGVRPRFGAPRTVFRFAAADLSRTLPQANPHSQALAEQMCRDVVARRRGRSGVTEQVRVWIARNLPHIAQVGGMAQAAAHLSMSERTLRRHLVRSGTGYQALLDEVRQALAEEMLDTGVLSVDDVAHRLGYAEASSFIHAFKRWHGETPAQFRLRRMRRAAPGSAG